MLIWMSQPQNNRVNAKKLINATKEVGQANNELKEVMQGIPAELSSVKDLLGEDENSATLGKKLVKVGTFLVVAIPEPFISDITGTVLIASGLVMNRFSRRNSVKGFHDKFQKDLREIEALQRAFSSLT